MANLGKSAEQIVNRWTDFDKLEEVIVGLADDACFPPHEPACEAEFNDAHVKFGTKMSHNFSDYVPWPTGPKLRKFTDAANKELNNLTEVLEGEGVTVRRPDKSLIQMNCRTNSPDWESPNQYCVVCPRDVVMTIGHEMVEATMSKRSRYWEFRPFRPLLRDYFDRDPLARWTCAPKPLMRDESYSKDFWKITEEERVKRMTSNYGYCTTEKEIFFDAADCNLIGDVMFVQHSMTTNVSGIRWLKRHFEPQGIEVRALHFPYDLYPSHMDCTFVSVRPGLMLTNPDRPVVPAEVKIFKENDWRFVDVPFYSTEKEHPVFCQSSRWLSMNVLSVSQEKIVVEEGETAMHKMLEEHGFDVIKVPFRNVFEFGGSLHCSTWDIRRQGGKKNYFENRETCAEDVGLNSVIDRSIGQNIGIPLTDDERVHPSKRARTAKDCA
jgi:glycine amidinotransferase